MKRLFIAFESIEQIESELKLASVELMNVKILQKMVITFILTTTEPLAEEMHLGVPVRVQTLRVPFVDRGCTDRLKN